ncbi:MAG: hypothetical protein ACE5KM_03390 [Planctomycetaceae bacterium]
MSPNSVTQFVTRMARLMSVGETTVYAGVIAAGILLVFSVGVFVQVLMISREKKVSLRTTLSHAAASLWAIPVLGVLAFFAYRVAEANTARQPTAQSVKNDREADVLRFQATEEAQSWVNDARKRAKTGKLRAVVISARGANVAHAERRLRQQVLNRLRQEYPGEADGVRPAAVDPLVKRRFSQPGYEQVGLHRNEVWKVYWLLDFSRQNRQAVRQAAVVPRLWTVGAAVTLLALVCVGVTLYLRLDASTAGRYRFRLKFATTALLVAAGMLVAAVVPLTA